MQKQKPGKSIVQQTAKTGGVYDVAETLAHVDPKSTGIIFERFDGTFCETLTKYTCDRALYVCEENTLFVVGAFRRIGNTWHGPFRIENFASKTLYTEIIGATRFQEHILAKLWTGYDAEGKVVKIPVQWNLEMGGWDTTFPVKPLNTLAPASASKLIEIMSRTVRNSFPDGEGGTITRTDIATSFTVDPSHTRIASIRTLEEQVLVGVFQKIDDLWTYIGEGTMYAANKTEPACLGVTVSDDMSELIVTFPDGGRACSTIAWRPKAKPEPATKCKSIQPFHHERSAEHAKMLTGCVSKYFHERVRLYNYPDTSIEVDVTSTRAVIIKGTDDTIHIGAYVKKDNVWNCHHAVLSSVWEEPSSHCVGVGVSDDFSSLLLDLGNNTGAITLHWPAVEKNELQFHPGPLTDAELVTVRSITTLSSNSGDFRHLQCTLELPAVVGHKDPFSAILHETYPKGFFSDNLFIGVEVDERGDETCVFVMHDLTVSGKRRQFEIAYVPCDKFEALFTKLKTFEFDPPVHIEVIRCIGPDGSIDAVKQKYDAKDNFEAHPEFYPFIQTLKGFGDKTSIEDIINDFMLAKANLLFFIGKPGSAKSTLIRAFFRKGFDVRIINNAAALDSPALPRTFRMETPENGDRLLTVYEDADRFVSPRKDGNMSVSAMLNQLDGAVGSKEKFIISTNLESLRSVDPAILRRGRCHRVFEFRDLTPEEVNVARKAVGLEPIDVKTNLSVADALNWDGVTIEKRQAAGVGFIA